MKQKISGPVAVVIIVVVSVAIIGFLFKQNFADRHISPEETKAAMARHFSGDSKGH